MTLSKNSPAHLHQKAHDKWKLNPLFTKIFKIQFSKFNLNSHHKNAEFQLKLRDDFSTLIANLNIKRSTCDKKNEIFNPFFYGDCDGGLSLIINNSN
jgi:hypothetical protein